MHHRRLNHFYCMTEKKSEFPRLLLCIHRFLVKDSNIILESSKNWTQKL